MKDRVCSIVPKVQEVKASILIPGFAMGSGGRTCLVYHVDEGLGVVLGETADHLRSILARKDGLDQGCAIGHGERAFDQTPNGRGVEI